MKRALALFLLFFSVTSSYAQQFKTIIPYTMVGDKMVIEIKIIVVWRKYGLNIIDLY